MTPQPPVRRARNSPLCGHACGSQASKQTNQRVCPSDSCSAPTTQRALASSLHHRRGRPSHRTAAAAGRPGVAGVARRAPRPTHVTCALALHSLPGRHASPAACSSRSRAPAPAPVRHRRCQVHAPRERDQACWLVCLLPSAWTMHCKLGHGTATTLNRACTLIRS